MIQRLRENAIFVFLRFTGSAEAQVIGENDWTDRDAVGVEDLDESKKTMYYTVVQIPHEKGQF